MDWTVRLLPYSHGHAREKCSIVLASKIAGKKWPATRANSWSKDHLEYSLTVIGRIYLEGQVNGLQEGSQSFQVLLLTGHSTTIDNDCRAVSSNIVSFSPSPTFQENFFNCQEARIPLAPCKRQQKSLSSSQKVGLSRPFPATQQSSQDSKVRQSLYINQGYAFLQTKLISFFPL
jgi:hypothetical protein